MVSRFSLRGHRRAVPRRGLHHRRRPCAGRALRRRSRAMDLDAPRELPPVLSQPGRGRGAALAAAHGPVVVNEYADNPGGGTPATAPICCAPSSTPSPRPAPAVSRPSTTPLSSIRPGRPAWAPPSACRWAASRGVSGRTAARECLRQGHHRRPFHQPRRLHVRRRALRPGRDVPLAHPGRGRHRRLARRTDL